MTIPVLDRVDRLHRDLRTGQRVYALTPRRLRRPEPALRAATAAITVWFVTLFLALAVQADGSIGVTPSGYLVATLCGTAALVLVAKRQLRAALWCLAAMLVMGQSVTMLGLVTT